MTTQPRLLDLFCGAGGASVGYHRAGFDVVGVDIRPQPRYPFEFHQADALKFLKEHGAEFQAIHASPPCQAFTQMSARYRGKGGAADSHADWLNPTLDALLGRSAPWIVENVPGAVSVYEARRLTMGTVRLHGGMFGLGVHRPRLFGSNVVLLEPFGHAACRRPIGVYGAKPDGRPLYSLRNNGNYKTALQPKKSVIRCARGLEEGQQAMGIDWMEWAELKEAIPPAYTRFLGKQLLAHVRSREPAA